MGQASSVKIVVLGRVGAPFGVQGWVHIQSYTSPIENILSYKHWFIRQSSKEVWNPIGILQWRKHGKQYVALLEGCLNRDQAQHYTLAELGVERYELPNLNDDGHYWEDLIGLSVVTETGVPLGVVEGLFETGANDVIIVKETKENTLEANETSELKETKETKKALVKEKERLIPFVPEEVIVKVDLNAKILVVRWDPEF